MLLEQKPESQCYKCFPEVSAVKWTLDKVRINLMCHNLNIYQINMYLVVETDWIKSFTYSFLTNDEELHTYMYINQYWLTYFVI